MFQNSFTLATAVLGSAFSPVRLFAAGEQGVWYDPSDFATMYQDSAGTTPVTAVGQPVGLIRDKSGRGNHASQATAGSRPTLGQETTGQYYLAFDGTASSLSTASIDFTATDKMTVWAGVRKLLEDGTAKLLTELSNNGTNIQSFSLFGATAVANTYSWRAYGSVSPTPVTSPASYAPPITNVISATSDIAAPSMVLRVNGAVVASGTATMGTGNQGNYPLYICSRGGASNWMAARLYGLIVRGARSADAHLAQAEAWMNGKTGAY